MITKNKALITYSKLAEKELRKLPLNIIESLSYWVEIVSKMGLSEVRKISGYHDEPLKGERKGQRSIRLNKAYRAIYIQHENEEIELIEIIEVNKHKY